MTKHTLDAKRLGLAGGIVWGAAVLLLGFIAIAGYGNAWVILLSDIYLGYKATLLGAIIGGIYGFIDGFIGCYVLAWLYNRL